MLIICRTILIGCLFAWLHACAGDASSDETPAAGSGADPASETDPGRLAINSLIDAAPAEMQVASPTRATGDVATLTNGQLVIGLTQDSGATEESGSYLAKLKAFVDVAGSSDLNDCQPDFEVTLPTQPGCYNQVVYKDANDGFTSDNIFFDASIQPKNINDTNTVGLLDDGSGIVASTADGSPCSKLVTEYYIDTIGSSFDRAQSMVASLLCVAKANGLQSLPEAGAELDLSSAASSAWQEKLDLHVAKIVGLTVGEVTAYNTIISASYETEAGDSQDIVVDVLNIPVGTDSANYRGRFFIYDKRKNNPQAGPVPFFVTSQYEKSDDAINILVKEVGLNFTEQPSKFLDAKGMLKFSLFTSDAFEAPGNQAGGPAIGLLAFNSKDGTGTVSFQRSPALGGTEVANAFMVSVTKNDDDSLSACALQGHGLSPVNEQGQDRDLEDGNDLSIYRVRGFYCMKGQSDGTYTGGENLDLDGFTNQFGHVQQQCFTRSSESESWQLSEDHITYTVAYNQQGACGSNTPSSDQFDLVAIDTALESVDSDIFQNPPSTEGLSFDTEVDYGLDFSYVP